MLKSEKIIVRVANHKENSIDKISNFVRFLCYRSEYEKLSRAFSTMRSEIESHDSTVEDVNTIEPASLFMIDGFDVKKFLDTREDLKKVRKILSSLANANVNEMTFDSLSNTDKVFLTLQAHTAVKSIKLDASILVKEDGEKYDFSPLIKKWYASGQGLSNIKKSLSKIFSSIVSEEGVLFYPVKVKGGDIPDKDIRHFLAMFGGKAVREGKAQNGKFVWDERCDEKVVLNHLTTLLAVVFESGNCETIKPEEKPEETK
jgi:hypothetical protein